MTQRTIKTKNEYYQIKNKPTQEELLKYYEKKYYQHGIGSYEKEYSEEELQFTKDRQKYLEFCLRKIHYDKFKDKTFLDIGCGEGWSLSHFNFLGCKVKGVDFSSFGIEKFNPDILKYFKKGNIYDFIYDQIEKSNLWDIINLSNVIEHVLEPEELIFNLKSILSKGGKIICTFPNDYSPFQKLLLKNKKIDSDFWVTIPDHISYFNKESFTKMAQSLGLHIELLLADFPIDIFLLNEHSNYINNTSKGKEAHYARIRSVNLLNQIDFNTSVETFINLGKIGFGRNLTAFMSIDS